MNQTEKNSYTKRLFWYALIPCVISFTITRLIFSFVTISGESMAPSLKNKERVVISRVDKSYDRGEIVVFQSKENDPAYQPGQDFYVKRVIGVEGDTVEYKDGHLYVNKKEVDQSFIKSSDENLIRSDYERSTGTSIPYNNNWTLKQLSQSAGWNSFSQNRTKVPAGCVFVMGDHRSHSQDSRYFGFVKTSSIVGVVKEMPFSNQQIHEVVTKPSQNFFK